MKKRRVFLTAGALLAALCLSGCGSDETTLSKMETSKYVELGTYKGLEVSVPKKQEVTEEYKQNYVDYILSQHPSYTDAPKDWKAETGDIVNIDYVGKIDGEAFEGGSDQGFDLQLGSHRFIDGFEDGLIGAVSGETRDVELSFPDPYPPNPDLAGSPVVFTVTVNSIQKAQTPELTDEFVLMLGVGCETVAEYDEYVTKLLEEESQQTYDNNLEQALVDKAMEGCTFQEPPKAMEDQYYDRAVRNVSRMASANGMTLEAMVTGYFGSTMEDFEAQAREGAVLSCKESIMLQEIANREGITVTQKEVDAALEEAAAEGGFESVDKLKEAGGDENYEDYVMCEKVLALLKENAVITEMP